MPLASVIIPARNVEKTVGATLESLLKQNFKDYEVIVVNDHSTDTTKEVCTRYNVKVVDSIGRGVNAARNAGVKEAKGDIIAFIDGDAVAPQDWLSKLVNSLTSSGADIVFGGVKALNSDKLVSRYVESSILGLMPNFRSRKLVYNRQVSTVVAGCNMGFRRRVWEEVGFFDESYLLYYDELDFEAKALSKGFKMLLEPNLVVYHRNVERLVDLLRRAWRQTRALKTFSVKNPDHPIVLIIRMLCLLVSLCLILVMGSIVYYLFYVVNTVFTFDLAMLALLYVGLTFYYLARNGRLVDSLIFPFLDFIVGLTMYFRVLMNYLSKA
ncbi:MAG: glycosyltransferase [Candidatus Nezhaarchaeales archaeon]